MFNFCFTTNRRILFLPKAEFAAADIRCCLTVCGRILHCCCVTGWLRQRPGDRVKRWGPSLLRSQAPSNSRQSTLHCKKDIILTSKSAFLNPTYSATRFLNFFKDPQLKTLIMCRPSSRLVFPCF